MADGQTMRCGFVALIGAPNAGKSTLMNALVGTKLSIVTHKVQTTRAIVRGIAMVGDAQIIFVDTPGIFAPKRRLDRAMVTNAWSGATDADIVCLLVDAQRGLDDANAAILDKLAATRQKRILILNKVDAVRRETLLDLTKAIDATLRFDETFMVSALTGDGVDDLLAHLGRAVPAGPWLYPEDQISDAPMRLLAAEITREKLFLRLHEELPYESTVETDSLDGDEGRLGAGRADDLRHARGPEKDRHRQGRRDHQGDLGGRSQGHRGYGGDPGPPVPLRKVRENWGDDPARYREMGLEFPNEKR